MSNNNKSVKKKAAYKEAATLSPIEKILNYNYQKDLAESPEKSVISLKISDTEKIDVTVKRRITLSEKSSFVSAAAESVFVGEEYNPSLLSSSISVLILWYYTDLDFNVSDENILSKLECSKNIIQEILYHVDMQQYENITDSIAHLIEFKKNIIIASCKKELDNNLRSLNTATEMCQKLIEQFNEVDINDLFKTINNFSEKNEKKIVNSILDRKDAPTDSSKTEKVIPLYE